VALYLFISSIMQPLAQQTVHRCQFFIRTVFSFTQSRLMLVQ